MKNNFDFMFDVYLNHKTNLDKIEKIDNKTINYLKKLLAIYYDENHTDTINKYKDMLKFVGENEVTKIARDIKLCINNLERKTYQKEYDCSEKLLVDDILYIQNIINRFSE